MAQRVLVTGGSGYLGSILCEHLLDAGYEVSVVDNLMYNQSTLLHFCNNQRFNFVRGDARDQQLIASMVKSADVIIPLAAIVGAPACDRDPVAATSINFEAIRMINGLRSTQQLLIYPNTNSGYGTKSGAVFCDEETPLEPISLYGSSKVNAEQDVLQKENSIVLRLATVFGTSPRMRLDLLVNHFVYVAMTDRYIVIFEKDFKRNYIHIRDVADCFLHCITSAPSMRGRPYNVGLDEANLSKEELALKVKEYFPDFFIHFSEIGQDVDKRNYIVSNKRLREAGFTPRRSIDEGIQELKKGLQLVMHTPFKNI